MKYQITVMEPYEFDYFPSSFIIGNIVKIIDERNLIFISDDNFTYNTRKSNVLLLTSRNEESRIINKELITGIFYGNIVIDPMFDYNIATLEEINQHAKYIFFGELEIIQ